MEIDGRVVSPQDFAHGIAAATQAGIRVNQKRRAAGLRPYDITEFDTLTVAAMVIYAEKGVKLRCSNAAWVVVGMLRVQ